MIPDNPTAVENPTERSGGKHRAVGHLISAVLFQGMRAPGSTRAALDLIAIAWPLTHLCVLSSFY